MKSPGTTAAIPTAYAAELTLELSLMRDECVNAARVLMARHPIDETALEECARLDDALAKAHRVMQSALKSIRLLRASRSGPQP